jgi:hypothetical protein
MTSIGIEAEPLKEEIECKYDVKCSGRPWGDITMIVILDL